MSDAGALVRRLRSGSRVAQLQALRGLGELALSSPGAGRDAVAAGAVAAIVQLKGLSSSGTVQEAAAYTLRVLSQEDSPATLAAFLEAGAIRTLASMLQNGISSGSDKLQLHATTCLWTLAECDGGGVAAVAAGGGIRPLIDLLHARAGQPISDTDRAAAGALCVVAATCTQQFARQIVQLGVVPALLALLDRHSTAGTAGQPERRALEYAASALGSLAQRGSEHEAALVVAAGSVRSLVNLLSHSHTEVQAAAAQALLLLLRYVPARDAFAEAGAAPAVVLLLHSSSQDVQTQAVGVLGNAACGCAASSADMLAAGAMQPLVQLLRTPGHPAHVAVTVCLRNLCKTQPAAAAAAIQQAGGVVEALEQLAADSDDEGVREAAAQTKDIVTDSLEIAAEEQQASSSSSERAVSSKERGSGEAAPAAAEAPARPPRMCAAPGCGVTSGLRRCGGCQAVRYCSTECTRVHWRAHKAECRRLQAERAAAAADEDGAVQRGEHAV